ncbi:uncharacterized protein BDR25DRAFT_125621 [Lindgomyces ingoldianus]|uniref:Uncharacterized protein n=1 Tax=Lindgomyces ingoldianus TaxID=673940 RepID=A0ACB6R6C5_9PLEO|nr:uncharacterized protein BDR25DRAFT_125621 [Lindgomyces ingoldianus]KAF2473855.1 hypothetical protein BDR25DRAFT_125621 [Lindgomyces ingoldianus]
MLPALQPSRPKLPQKNPRIVSTHQQKRATHEQKRAPHEPSRPVAPLSPQAPTNTTGTLKPTKPHNQIQAMPPLGSPQTPGLFPSRNLYDSAVRHPVFFTEQLRKPPFPIPEMASQGWSPVASGYIMESRKIGAGGTLRTKL